MGKREEEHEEEEEEEEEEGEGDHVSVFNCIICNLLKVFVQSLPAHIHRFLHN